MSKPAGADGTPPGPLRRLLAALLGLLQSHLGVFSIELEEARERLVRTLVLVIVGAGCILLCLLTLTLAVILLAGEAYRLPAAMALFLVFGAVAFFCLRAAWADARDGGTPFSATLEELRRDRERLLP